MQCLMVRFQPGTLHIEKLPNDMLSMDYTAEHALQLNDMLTCPTLQ